jgi:hypothetical protein
MTLRKISEYTCLAIFAMSAFSYTLLAQSSPLPTGTVSVASGTPSSGCPTSDGWLSGVTCRYATVTCPESNGTTPLGITFGYETPASPKGTIVIFSHSGGTTPEAFPGNEGTIAGGYYNANYQVVQTKWDSDWEDESGTGLGGSIGLAACRPATFLAWVISNLYTPIYNSNPTAGMCVHGTSAGASAAAYSLAWYGLYANIDKVTMVSGPPMGDIEEGCIERSIQMFRSVHRAKSGATHTTAPLHGAKLQSIPTRSRACVPGQGTAPRMTGEPAVLRTPPEQAPPLMRRGKP